MTTPRMQAAALAIAAALAPVAALAHAQLQQATPAVGGVVSGSPKTLTLRFSEGVEARFSSITLAMESGGAIPLGKLGVDPADVKSLTVSIGVALKPGVYAVTWRAVSVDTHKTQGSYRFTVAP